LGGWAVGCVLGVVVCVGLAILWGGSLP
jgi:hypothetical protein